jgi:glc operon protein GlcG
MKARLAARSLLALVLSAFVVDVGAQTSMALNATLAQKIVNACAARATQKKQSHAIAIVDNSGALLAFLRMDGNPPGVGDFAVQKALAVASWRFSTQQMSKAAETTPGFAMAPKVVTVAGGVPIYARGGVFVGAVGVSGESPQDDTECAVAGITAAGFSTSSDP